MKKTTRILALALVLVMALGLLPISAGAVTVTEIVPPKYDRIDEFFDGLAAVNVGGHIDKYDNFVGGKWGYIDATGKEVVPIGKYIWARGFDQGLAAVRVDTGTGEKYGYDNGYRWGCIDTTGKEVVPYKYHKMKGFSEGLAAVNVGADKYGNGGEWGYIDTTGKEVVPCTLEYDSVGDFSEGFAAVCVEEYSNKKRSIKWGFIDKTGKEVAPCKYDEVENFSEGLARVQLNGKYGFIDETGKEVIPCKYDYVSSFSEGLATVKGSTGEIKNGKTVYAYGVIDTQGNVVIPCKYDRVEGFDQGLAAVKLDGKWGFVDTTGKEVVPCKYENYYHAPEFHDGLAGVEVAAGQRETVGLGLTTIYKWGFIDKTGQEVVPCKYYYVGDFDQGLAAVSVGLNDRNGHGGTWGFIDKTGKEVIPCKYDNYYGAPVFHEGLAAVKTDNGWGCIDLYGNEVVTCQYGEVKLLSAGMVAVQVDGKWGVFRVEGLPTEPKPVPTPTPTPEPTAPTGYTAKATNDKLTVDGVSKAPTAYKINNANYFQLRDVAVLLNDTKAQFSVDYDNAAKAIKITTGQPYQPNGKEMKGAKATAEAIVGNNDVYINGVKTDFAVYKIGGSNFFQIRDLGKALGFNVDWAKDVGIIIDPSKPYSGK